MPETKIPLPSVFERFHAVVVGECNGLQAIISDVPVGGEIPLHTHRHPTLSIVLEGRAKLVENCGSERVERAVGPGAVIIQAPGQIHGFFDVVEPLRMYAVGPDLYRDGNPDIELYEEDT